MEKITIYKIRQDSVFDGDVEFWVDDLEKSPIPAGHTRSSPHPIPAEHHAVMQGGWKYIAGEPPLFYDHNLAVKVRDERNKLLKDSDWTQLADSPVDKTAWSIYRQVLRDIPTQVGFPASVSWPIKPE